MYGFPYLSSLLIKFSLNSGDGFPYRKFPRQTLDSSTGLNTKCNLILSGQTRLDSQINNKSNGPVYL